MLRAFEKDTTNIKENIRRATQILDKKLPLQTEERNYVIDVLITTDKTIDELMKKIQSLKNLKRD